MSKVAVCYYKKFDKLLIFIKLVAVFKTISLLKCLNQLE